MLSRLTNQPHRLEPRQGALPEVCSIASSAYGPWHLQVALDDDLRLTAHSVRLRSYSRGSKICLRETLLRETTPSDS